MEFHYWFCSMATSRMDRTHYHGPCRRLLSPSEQQQTQSSYWSTVDRTLTPGPGPASTLQSQPALSKVPYRQTNPQDQPSFAPSPRGLCIILLRGFTN